MGLECSGNTRCGDKFCDRTENPSNRKLSIPVARPELEGVGLLSGLAPTPEAPIPLPWFPHLFIHKSHRHLVLSAYSVSDRKETRFLPSRVSGAAGETDK